MRIYKEFKRIDKSRIRDLVIRQFNDVVKFVVIYFVVVSLREEEEVRKREELERLSGLCENYVI